MLNIPTLRDAMRVSDNKSKFLRMTGTPMANVNWMDAERTAQSMQPQAPRPPTSTGSLPAPRGPGGPMSGTGGMAPPMAPGEFWDPQTGSKVIGSSARGMKGTGGPTWSGGAI